MPGQLILYHQESGETVWLIMTPGSPNEPGRFGWYDDELQIAPVVYVPGSREPSSKSEITPYSGSGKGKGALAFAELEAYSRRLGAPSVTPHPAPKFESSQRSRKRVYIQRRYYSRL